MAKAKNKGILDEPDLQHLAYHSVGNSRALLEEAEILFERGRWPRAAALAILAVEESGKAHLCHVWAFHVLPTVDDPTDPAAWQDFWDSFADHPGKFDRWLSRVDGFGGCPDFGAWKHEASRAHLSKLACLYVDWAVPERAVTTPEAITADARQFVEIARDALAYWDRTDWSADR